MHTPIDKSKTGYEEYQKVRTAVNKALSDKQLPDTIEGVSGVVDKELTWLANLDYNWQCQLVQHSLAGKNVVHRKLKCHGVWRLCSPKRLNTPMSCESSNKTTYR